MKKTLVILGMVLAVTGTAFAQKNQNNANGNCPSGNCPSGDCMMYDGYHNGYHNGNNHGNYHGRYHKLNPEDIVVKSANDAKKLIASQIKDLKGYKIEYVETIKAHGHMNYESYRVYVKDAGENKFYYHVSPVGSVRGAVPYDKNK